MKKNTLLIIFILLLTSCSTILKDIYGVKELKEFNNQEYEKTLSRIKTYNVEYYSFISDSANFRSLINLGDSILTEKDLYQPIQILYFENNRIISFHANCYAKGTLRKLNWNYDNRFSIFPPKSAIPLKNENKITFETLKKIFPQLKNIEEKRYSVVIYWTTMLENISKDAIETVFKNIVKFDEVNKTNVYLINTDKFFISMNTAHNNGS